MKKIIYFFLITMVISSCDVKYQTIPYFVNLPAGDLSEKIANQTVLKIQKDDILAITVSSLNAEANEIFNTANTNGGGRAPQVELLVSL